MTVKDLIERFGMHLAAGRQGLDKEIKGGYCGDLLSDVMGNSPQGCVWLTIQTHQNIVTAAVIREMAAIILTGGKTPDEETLQKADEEGMPVLLWPGTSYDLAGRLYSDEGIKN
ncbi:MAG: serine kinase [Deltaproteobacteria bacterium]|nr:serine kinase [Deltaproteobacteria bacterium]